MLSIAAFACNMQNADDFFLADATESKNDINDEEMKEDSVVSKQPQPVLNHKKRKNVTGGAKPMNLSDELDEQPDSSLHQAKRRKLNASFDHPAESGKGGKIGGGLNSSFMINKKQMKA